MEKIKQALFSENGMKIVNALFLLSMFIRNRGIILIAYVFWIIYLVYCIKNTSSITSRIIYKIFIVFAVVMVLVNVYLYITLLLSIVSDQSIQRGGSIV